MSLSSALNIAVSGLQTAQRQINITSGNVSNANVEGYSRQTASAVTNMTGSHNTGVDLSQVRREVNSYLDGEVRRANTELGALQAENTFMQRLTEMFGTLENDSTLANGINDLSAAMEQLANEPNSAAVRNDVVEAADELARQLNRFSGETNNLRVEADREVASGVEEVNSALSRINELNAEISKAKALNQPTASLEDERDRQLDTVTEWMDVKTFERATGEVVVVGFTDDGTTANVERSARTLVDSTAVQFEFSPSNQLAPGVTGNAPNVAGEPDTQLNTTVGGKLGALIEMRDQTLTGFQSDVDRLAQTLRDRVNAAHNLGTVGNRGQATITGSTDVTGDTGLSVEPNPGPAIITVNRIDGDGTVLDSHDVDISGLTNPTAIATQIDSAHADISASINGSGQLEISAGGGTAGLTIDSNDVTIDGAYTSGPGYEARGFSHYFGLNNLLETPGIEGTIADAGDVTGAAGTFKVRDDIKTDPSLLSRGTASSTVGQPAVADGDNTVASGMADAFESSGTVLASSGAGGNLPKTDTTLSGYAGDLLSFHATRADRVATSRDFQQDLHNELQYRADSESGVNIDEELSNMVMFEQSYNASARVISTVQQMFDTLDRMMN